MFSPVFFDCTVERGRSPPHSVIFEVVLSQKYSWLLMLTKFHVDCALHGLMLCCPITMFVFVGGGQPVKMCISPVSSGVANSGSYAGNVSRRFFASSQLPMAYSWIGKGA